MIYLPRLLAILFLVGCANSPKHKIIHNRVKAKPSQASEIVSKRISEISVELEKTRKPK